MNTPICDFVAAYAASGTGRLHMPGHKGRVFLGWEQRDITEISGAGYLYGEAGIVRESERGAASLFGTKETFYSTEGSSQCIRAMLYLAMLNRPGKGKPCVIAGRNVHKSFVSAAALLDMEVEWLWPQVQGSLCSCPVTPGQVAAALNDSEDACAVYLTSPDYLGGQVDIAAVAGVCHDKNVPLLVDNAHGAYLKFLPEDRHPITLGADMCCDSAHKTLPVVTGGAYLHVSGQAPDTFFQMGKRALELFGSTSPSYLILQSLDMANRILAEEYREELAAALLTAQACRQRLSRAGWQVWESDPLKITLRTKPFGYTGEETADILREKGMECEFADPDHIVLMVTPANPVQDLEKLADVLCAVPRRPAIETLPPVLARPRRACSIRQAMFSPCETVPAAEAVGRILGETGVSCPPAVPVAVSGEIIDESAADAFTYYGIENVSVLREKTV